MNSGAKSTLYGCCWLWSFFAFLFVFFFHCYIVKGIWKPSPIALHNHVPFAVKFSLCRSLV